jgi:hypothetical protein
VFNAKVAKNFISKEDCQYLVNLAKYWSSWEGGGSEFWDNRVANYQSVFSFDKKAARIMLDANRNCAELIKKEYGLQFPVYSDTLQVIRWFPGMEQSPHADDMSNTDVQGFSHRAFGSIIYLNDDYKGGHTFYPNFDIEIVPEAGSLAVHPGDPEHLHGVTKIEDSIRYTIASFWTFDKEKSHGWPVPE